jgi:hypothetical protein
MHCTKGNGLFLVDFAGEEFICVETSHVEVLLELSEVTPDLLFEPDSQQTFMKHVGSEINCLTLNY